MRDFTSRLVARGIDTLRIHEVRLETHDGVVGFHKRRRTGMSALFGPGNLFLRWSNSGIQMFADPAEWQQHEMESFLLCHPHRVAKPLGKHGLFLERLPGESLRSLSQRKALDSVSISAAAVELRRVHALRDPREQEPWSHGDPHLGNFLFDRERCYLIDFETAHLPGSSAIDRQTDDVLTFCLELLGQKDPGEAAQSVMTFVDSYNRPEFLTWLRDRLQFPHGLERVLWATRTNYVPAGRLRSRLQMLKSALGG